eukprot:512933_1
MAQQSNNNESIISGVHRARQLSQVISLGECDLREKMQEIVQDTNGNPNWQSVKQGLFGGFVNDEKQEADRQLAISLQKEEKQKQKEERERMRVWHRYESHAHKIFDIRNMNHGNFMHGVVKMKVTVVRQITIIDMSWLRFSAGTHPQRSPVTVQGAALQKIKAQFSRLLRGKTVLHLRMECCAKHAKEIKRNHKTIKTKQNEKKTEDSEYNTNINQQVADCQIFENDIDDDGCLSYQSQPHHDQQNKKQDEKRSLAEEKVYICDENMGINDLETKCESFKRIEMVLKAYDQLMNTTGEVQIFDVIQNKGKYDHQQLFDDFMHVKIIHIDADNDKIRSHDNWEHMKVNEQKSDDNNENKQDKNEDNEKSKNKNGYIGIGKEICSYFQNKFRCNSMIQCRGFARHYKHRITKTYERKSDVQKQTKYPKENMEQKYCAEDESFRDLCDTIHTFFLHSTIQFGIKYNETNVEEEDRIDKITQYTRNSRLYSRRYSDLPKSDLENDAIDSVVKTKNKLYIGKKEDDEWWNHIPPDNKPVDTQQIYRELVKKMGVFRWQNPHGFEAGQNQQVSHYTPQFKNIKEEVMQNKCHPLTTDNWNQTLRKSQIFLGSWAGQRVSTQFKGYYDDQITQHSAKWIQGENIKLPDILTLKLYTDFDKLQFELKKCFRFETFDRILPLMDEVTAEEID